MNRAIWFVVPVLLAACSGSSSEPPKLTGVWVLSATAAEANDCDLKNQAFVANVIQRSTSRFDIGFLGYDVTGRVSGSQVTFGYETGNCTAYVTGDVDGIRMSGVVRFDCDYGGGDTCRSELSLSGTRQVAAQALCEQYQVCQGFDDETLLACTGYYAEDVLGLDPDPAATVACIRSAASSASCELPDSKLGECLDVDYAASTCKDATTLTLYNGSGAHSDVDCAVLCAARYGASGGCAGHTCSCVE